VVQVRASVGGTWATFADAVSASTGVTVTGLSDGTSYDFQVAAVNAVGQGSYGGSVTMTPVVGVPAAPAIGLASAGDGQAVVAFTPVATGGGPLTYTVTSIPGGLTGTAAAGPITVTGLSNGTSYTFTVTATNATGTGAASAASNAVTPAGLPGAPTGLNLVPGNSQVALSWTAAGNNGAAITDYVVQYRVTGTVSWQTANDGVSPATGTTVIGLAGGTSYDFQVIAVNAVGAGAAGPTASTTTTAAAPQLLPDPGFEVGNSGWIPFNVGTLTRVSTPVHGGSYALKVAATSATVNLVGLTQNSVVSNSVAGTTYTASCYVQPTSSNLNVQIRFLEYTQNYASSIHFLTTTVAQLPMATWTLVKISSVAVKSGERMIPQIYSTNETTNTGSLLYDDCTVTATK
jgi:hypothetical protein